MTKHSVLGASSCERWMACPGSVEISRGITNVSNNFAMEGTAAHNLAETALLKMINQLDWNGFVSDTKLIAVGEGEGQANIEVTEEMRHAVRTYVEVVMQGITNEYKVETFVELKVSIPSISDTLFGTADCVQYYPKTKYLRVIDFKYGAGKRVEVYRNKQLMYYALGAIETKHWDVKEIELAIVQPRVPNGEQTTWVLTRNTLLDFYSDLKMAVESTKLTNKFTPGDHCQFCPAMKKCPEIPKKAQELMTTVSGAATTYTPVELSKILDNLPAIKKWVDTVENAAKEKLLSGGEIPGYKLIGGTKKRVIVADRMPDFASAAGVELADLKTETWKGIKELESLAPGKNSAQRAAFLSDYVVYVSTAERIVKSNVPGEEVSTASLGFDKLD